MAPRGSTSRTRVNQRHFTRRQRASGFGFDLSVFPPDLILTIGQEVAPLQLSLDFVPAVQPLLQ